MAQVVGAEVFLTGENVGSCMCPKCPVQSDSKCVKEKLGGIQKALKKYPIKREDIPGVYCSTGTATCRDLGSTKSCMCKGCPVFSKYNLATATPVGHYCRGGSPK